MADRVQTLNEEVANTITHGVGILFSLIAIPFMVIYAMQNASSGIVWAVSIFGFGMLMVYMSSTLYHAVQKTDTKRRLRIWDHISIFLLIAGTYTPMIVKFTSTSTAIIFLSIMWTIVALGSVMKIFFTGKYKIISVALYVAMGWMAVFVIRPLAANVPAEIFWWLLAGGLAYMLGVIFYLWKKLQYHHAVWHVFVLTGTVTHFFAVYNSIPVQVHLQ
ncbi:MAG: putative rane protein hemolysin III-like protein [Bacteroidota bacterium]|nr:putative rane protein hemolysin III-like protein [Bacteroidota bacterium]